LLSETRHQEATTIFFKEILGNAHCVQPRVIDVDKNAAYPSAFEACKQSEIFSQDTKLCKIKYLNNTIEQDQIFTKRRVAYSQWLQSFITAKATIAGYETMHMIRKGQVKNVGKEDVIIQIKYIEKFFGIAA